MKTPNPSFSFVICCFNEAAYIGSCIDSINTEMRHYTYPYEIIVIDDGSTDNTWLKACKEKVRVFSEPHQGVSASRQKGLERAQYEYCAMLDADSRMPSGWVDTALNTFESNPQIVAVSGSLRFYDAPEYLNVAAKHFYKLAKFFHKWYPTLQGGNYIAKREALQKSQAYNSTRSFWGEDTYTAVQLSKIGIIELNQRMVMNTSGRRLVQNGAIKTTTQYIANYISENILHRPVKFKQVNYR